MKLTGILIFLVSFILTMGKKVLLFCDLLFVYVAISDASAAVSVALHHVCSFPVATMAPSALLVKSLRFSRFETSAN